MSGWEIVNGHEEVRNYYDIHQYVKPCTMRLKVPGGWIYTMDNQMAVFVPEEKKNET